MSNTPKTTTRRAAQAKANKPEPQAVEPITFDYDEKTYTVDVGWMNRPTGEQALVLLELDDGEALNKNYLKYLRYSGVDLRTIYLDSDWLDGFMEALDEAIEEQGGVDLGEGSGSAE